MANLIQRFFKSSKPEDDTLIEAAPIVAAIEDMPGADALNATPPMDVAYAQNVGRMRDHNEDALSALTGTLAGHDKAPDFGLFVVADGMGGHSMGELASAVTTRTIVRVVTEKIYLALLAVNDDDRQFPPVQEILTEAIESANHEVLSSVGEGGGTTATVALVLGSRVTIAHVGDSRAYFVTPSELQLLTRDHSLVQRLQEFGQLTAEEAAVHPQKNVLYRAVGQGEGLEIDVDSYSIPADASLFLCSDGLWGLVEDPDLLKIIQDSSSLQEACEKMIDAANEGGGPDNITALMVGFHT